MHILEGEAKQAIHDWKYLIDLFGNGNVPIDAFMDYFGNNNCFKISEKEITFWGKQLKGEPVESQKIHIYAGLDNCQLHLYLIDSKSDRTSNFNQTIFKKALTHKDINESLSGVIDYPKAKKRIKLWETDKKSWAERVQSGIIFKVIEIGYDDYVNLHLEENQECFNFLALNNSVTPYEIEVIAVAQKASGIHVAEDFSSPRPPFHINPPGINYKLLELSDYSS